MRPLVSVCMCTCNSSEYIVETLTSVLSQTYKNMEVLICDNGSSDDTIELIEKFHDPRIKLYSMSCNIGAYNGLNYLIDHANGKYIAIQDHDDLRLPSKIEKQVRFLEENKKYVGCGTNTCMWFEGDGKCFYYDFARECSWVIHPSLMFRNFKQHYNQKREYMCDCYFMKYTLCDKKKIMYNLPECLTVHRIKLKLDNYSYSRFTFNKINLNTVFSVHNPFYALCMVGFELCRKWFYPYMSIGSRYKFERFPFILKGYKIYDYKDFRLKNVSF